MGQFSVTTNFGRRATHLVPVGTIITLLSHPRSSSTAMLTYSCPQRTARRTINSCSGTPAGT